MKPRKFLLRLKDLFFPPLCHMEMPADYWTELLAEHKIQSVRRVLGWAWSCSCGEKGLSADRRDHSADVVIRAINIRRGGSVKYTPKLERIRRKAILAALDEAAKERQEEKH